MHLDHKWRQRNLWILTVILMLAFVVRVTIALLHPNVIHPDESIQYMEQANRAVTGNGYVPWEYTIGARSWLMPGMLIPVMWLCKIAAVSPIGIFAATRVFASFVSLICVVSAFYLGRRAGGPLSGLVSAAFIALWPEITVMSAHFLADTVCVIPLLIGLAFGYRKAPTSKQLFYAGLAWGFVVVLRPQLAPAIAVAGFWIANVRWKRYAPIIAGGCVPLLISGLLDYVTWGQFFASTIRYVQVNSSGVADAFGTAPHRQYVVWEAKTWLFAAPLVIVMAAVGTKRLPLVTLMVAAIVLTFSLVGHKEERFIYPAIPLIFILAGVGTGATYDYLCGRNNRALALCGKALPFLWLVGIASAASSTLIRERATQEEPILRAFQTVDRIPDLCGVGFNRPDEWWRTASVYLPGGVRLYQYVQTDKYVTAPFNAVLLIDESGYRRTQPANGFARVQCYEGNVTACVYYRTGPCSAGHPLVGVPRNDVARIIDRLGYTR